MTIAAPARPTATTLPGPTKDDQRRQKDQARAWDAYRGKYKPPFDPRSEEDSKFIIMPDRCGPTVKIGMYLLFGQGVSIDLDDAAPAGAADALKRAWGDEDEKIVFLQELAISAGVNGHAFVQVIPPPAGYDPQAHFARFISIDPQTVSVITDEDDCRSVNTFIIQNVYQLPNNQTRTKRRIFYRVSPEEESPYGPTGPADNKATWQISTWEAQGSVRAQSFSQVGETLNWSYPFHPILNAQNMMNPHEFWGEADIKNSDIDMNEALAFVESNGAKIIYNQAHDIIAVEGANPNQPPIQNEPGKWPVLAPGVHLNAIAAHGDIPGSLSFASNLRDDMDEASGMNQVVLGRAEVLPRGTISGLALKMEYETALKKVSSKQRTLGRLLRKLCQVHLYFARIDPNADTIQVVLGWKDPVPVDEFSQWQSAPIEEQMGVSKTTILARRGMVYSAELKLREQEAKDEADAFNAGKGSAPAAIAAGNAPLPPEMQQMQQRMQNAAGAAQNEQGPA